ncbi:MAG: FkbM family methyltransferase [Rhodobacteraceae bacterium]|nr:FkbM family methyltransferase [Paracoccaceae bacterium]
MAVTPQERLARLLEAVRPGRRTRIADIGARDINRNPYRALMDQNLAEIWAFEPAEDGRAELAARDDAFVHILPDAIGSGEVAEFRSCLGGGFSSLYEPDRATLDYLGRWHRLTRVVARHEVATKRLDDVASLPNVDLLKIDIQGGELAAFQGGRDRLSEAVAVITEVGFLPLYQDQPTLADQMAELSGQGFILHKFLFAKAHTLLGPRRATGAATPPQSAGRWRCGLHPRHAGAERLSDGQLKQMAILADSVFQSFDLALRCLDLLEARAAVASAAADRYARSVPHRVDVAEALS